MRFPTQKEIVAALDRWKQERRVDNLKTDCYPKYVLACGRIGIPERSLGIYYRYLRGDSEIPYDQMIAVIESLECFSVSGGSDMDRFIDYCQTVSCDDVAHFTMDDMALAPSLVDSRTLGQTLRLSPEQLKSNRTRIDIMEWAPGMRTKWRKHEGHEFVHVLQGEVHCRFALEREGEKLEFHVKEDEGIAFPSKLFHEFWNPSKKEIRLVVARPAWCMPDRVEQ